jgi:hypothetical protein
VDFATVRSFCSENGASAVKLLSNLLSKMSLFEGVCHRKTGAHKTQKRHRFGDDFRNGA